MAEGSLSAKDIPKQSMLADAGVQSAIHTAVVPITLVLAGIVWRNRHTSGSRDLAALLLSIALWNALAPVTVSVPTLALKNLLAGLMLAMLAAAVYYLATFTAEYSGRGHWLTRRRRLLLTLHPIALIVLTVSDTSVGLTPSTLQHSLLYAGTSLDSATYYGMSITWGGAFWLHLVYSYLLVVASAYLIVDVIRSSNSVYSRQSLLLVAAVLFPLLSNVLDMFVPGISQTLGIAFFLTGVSLFVAVRSHDLSDITPVARDAVLDSIEGGVLVLDGEDRIVDANPAAIAFLDLDQRVIGQHASDALAHLDDVWERYAGVYDTHDQLSVETATGWRHFSIEISPLRGRSDEAGTARTVLVNDVTEQKQRERELENQKERLDQFAGLLSHDLRNPLNVAQGHLEMIQEESTHVERVAESHDRMGELIDEVLTIARTGRRVTDTEPVPVAQVARDAWRTVDTGDVTLAVDTESRIEADDDRLRTAFENLFRNAIEHGGEAVETIGVGVIGVDGRVFEPQQQGVFVEDDGPGIPPDERDVVLEAGHTTDPEGTGLGLSIVESVADAHGWTVEVTESEAGGARFELLGAPLSEPQSRDATTASVDN
jgi:signal transduction histidine kinase